MFPIKLKADLAQIEKRNQRRLALIASVEQSALKIHGHVHALHDILRDLHDIADDLKELDPEGQSALGGFVQDFIVGHGELNSAIGNFTRYMAAWQETEAQ